VFDPVKNKRHATVVSRHDPKMPFLLSYHEQLKILLWTNYVKGLLGKLGKLPPASRQDLHAILGKLIRPQEQGRRSTGRRNTKVCQYLFLVGWRSSLLQATRRPVKILDSLVEQVPAQHGAWRSARLRTAAYLLGHLCTPCSSLISFHIASCTPRPPL
jgi:hypothetical protein